MQPLGDTFHDANVESEFERTRGRERRREQRRDDFQTAVLNTTAVMMGVLRWRHDLRSEAAAQQQQEQQQQQQQQQQRPGPERSTGHNTHTFPKLLQVSPPPFESAARVGRLFLSGTKVAT